MTPNVPIKSAVSNRFVFNHVGQCVTDLARSRRFYEELLGFTFLRQINPPDESSARLLDLSGALGLTACYLRLDGFVLELLHYSAPERATQPRTRSMDEPGLTHISISCDIDAVRPRVAAYGGEVVESTDIEAAIFIRDPDRQLVELLPLSYADYVAALT